MNRLLPCCLIVTALGSTATARAAEPAAALPEPATVKALAVYPAGLALRGADDARQLVVTATLTDGRLYDLSGAVRYETSDPPRVRVASSGRVLPLANGADTITITYGDCSARVAVTCTQVDQHLPVHFANQVVPVFTKLGCNTGGCHGKASGQNGFKLSLLGFDPEDDYTCLVKESRGRRVFPASPENSLLLLKACGIVGHGGGKRMELGTDEYRLVRRWIAAGMPAGRRDDPTVTRISIFPEHRVLPRQGRQQVVVHAHYCDGQVDDVTRLAQYESNDTEIAGVDADGLVTTLDRSGAAAIMVRFQGHVAVCRASVPTGLPATDYSFPHQTLVDRHTQARWQQLGLAPAEPCSDEEFIRRVSLDITGTLPTPEQVRAFLVDPAADRRARLVDRLLDTPEYGYYFAQKWADLLRLKRGRGRATRSYRAYGTFGLYQWLHEAISADKPYDQLARALLTATGDEKTNPPVAWYTDLPRPENVVDDMAQLFLGVRIGCAQCHHHPFEKWSQDDYWGLAAFFGRIERRGGTEEKGKPYEPLTIVLKPSGAVVNKRTSKPAALQPLDGAPVAIDAAADPRQALADWMVKSDNPFFARAVVNRYWAHFFGRGIVDPLDDMRVTNPPTNPELLDALARDFVDNKYSLKHLVRTICNSRTYQLSSVPNESNRDDRQNYSRAYPRRLSAEVLLDAISRVTDSPTFYDGSPRWEQELATGLPPGFKPPARAIMLPDEAFRSYFLDVFGRPDRSSACACERGSDVTLAQALHLLNSNELQGKLTRAGGRADTLAKDARPDAEKVEELFLWAVSRKPSAEQKAQALQYLGQHADNKKLGYENLLWALLNTKEFVFNH